jgi:hypothetical protein
MVRRFLYLLQVIAILPFACTTAFAQNADTLTNAIGQALGTFVNGGSNTNPSNVPPNPSSAYGNVPPANSSGGGTGSSRTHHEKGIPHGIPHAAVAASAKARKWHTDAQLVMVDVDRNGPGGATETRFSFYSPSTGEGAWVNAGQLMPAGSVNWPTQPISANFVDLPEAVSQARGMGLRGPIDRAELMVGNQGLSWSVVPVQITSDSTYNIQASPGASPGFASAPTAPTYNNGQIPNLNPFSNGGLPTGGWSDYYRTHSTSGNSGIHWLPPRTPVGVGQDK